LQAPPLDRTRYALFLDFDGTLVDIAPTPDAVFAPAALPGLLAALSAGLDGALALVSGREIADLDARLKPFRGRAVGVHGAQIRADPTCGARTAHADLDPAVLADVRRLAAFDPRILIEDKGASIAVHYRAAVQDEARILGALEDYVAAAAGRLALLRGRKVVEILGGYFSKGEAVSRLMRAPPFAGRRPLMIGDDRTDVAAFVACAAWGGWGFRVAGGVFPANEADFSGPAAVRDWLAELAARLPSAPETGQ
jgi:trehalose 6-phosphate phosphatase